MSGTPREIAHDLPFWEAAERGVLLYKHCLSCDSPHWYPRAYCPFCGSAETEWRQASGRGTVYSFSLVATEPLAPAIVELEEGPRVTTVVAGPGTRELRIGDPVVVTFARSADGQLLPRFTPAP